MKTNFKEKLQNTTEKWIREQKIKSKKKSENQERISKELEHENRNLDKKGKIKKVFIWTIIVLTYDGFRMYLRYRTGRNLVEISDLVFSVIVIAIYAYFIFNYAKIKDKKNK